MIELLGPKQTGIALTAHHAFLIGNTFGNDFIIVFVGFPNGRLESLVVLVKAHQSIGLADGMKPATDGHRLAGRNQQLDVSGCLGAHRLRIDRVFFTVDDVSVKSIFGVGRLVRVCAKADVIGIIFCE